MAGRRKENSVRNMKKKEKEKTYFLLNESKRMK